MRRIYIPALFAGALLCFLAVAIGAFGAHSMSQLLTENNRLATFETANRYHFYHALALLFIALIPIEDARLGILKWASALMCGGVIIFSGSLYLLAVTNTTWLGAITPIGGVLFLIAWGLVIKMALDMHRFS